MDLRGQVQRLAAFVGARSLLTNESWVDHVVASAGLSEMKRVEGMKVSALSWAGLFHPGARGEHLWCGDEKGCPRRALVSAPQRQRLEERYEAVLRPLGVPKDFILQP